MKGRQLGPCDGIPDWPWPCVRGASPVAPAPEEGHIDLQGRQVRSWGTSSGARPQKHAVTLLPSLPQGGFSEDMGAPSPAPSLEIRSLQMMESLGWMQIPAGDSDIETRSPGGSLRPPKIAEARNRHPAGRPHCGQPWPWGTAAHHVVGATVAVY